MRRSRSHLATVVRPVGHNRSRDEERESTELSLGRTKQWRKASYLALSREGISTPMRRLLTFVDAARWASMILDPRWVADDGD